MNSKDQQLLEEAYSNITDNYSSGMNNLIQQVLIKLNKEGNDCFDLTNLNLKELKQALKEEGYSKYSKLSDIEEGIKDLFDTVGCNAFGIVER